MAGVRGFKIAKLYMDKAGTVVLSDMDMFMTVHSKEFADIESKMNGLVTDLTERKFVVRRYKIEGVLVDSRRVG